MRHLPFNKSSSFIFSTYVLRTVFFFCFGIDENNPYEVSDLGNFSVGLAVKHSATEFNILRFQRIQSKFSFKLNIFSSKRFDAVLI